MKTSRVVILGHSHTNAIRRALDKRVSYDPFEIYLFATPSLKGDLKTSEAIEMISLLKEDDILILAVGGNRHSVIGLLEHPNQFDLYDERQINDVHVGRSVIPYQTMLDDFSYHIENNEGKLLQRIIKATKAKVFQLESPPPKKETDYILKTADTMFRERIKAGNNISPDSIRIKLWKIQEKVFRQICDSHNISFISVPSQTITKEGFLKEKFYIGANATHANTCYGEAVLNKIEGIIANTE